MKLSYRVINFKIFNKKKKLYRRIKLISINLNRLGTIQEFGKNSIQRGVIKIKILSFVWRKG